MPDKPDPSQPAPLPPDPGARAPVVSLLLTANGLVFLLEFALPLPLMQYFALWPLGVSVGERLPGGLPAGHFELWQLVSYAFLHGSLFHLAINMFVLWMFGSAMEQVWGARRFTTYYFFCVIGAGLVQLLIVSSDSTRIVPTIGASGAVYAILLAFGLRFPNEIVLLIFPPIPMKAKYFVLLVGVIELWVGVSGARQEVANFAHLAGMLFGGLLILYWRQRPLPR